MQACVNTRHKTKLQSSAALLMLIKTDTDQITTMSGIQYD